MLDKLIAFEEGTLDAYGTVELFSQLIRSGEAWSLQGFYGRTAQALIAQGILDDEGNVNDDRLEELIWE